MFAIVLILVVVTVTARLVTVVRSDRSLNPPRSHSHEIDAHSARQFRVV
jgi:hypothetical protein